MGDLLMDDQTRAVVRAAAYQQVREDLRGSQGSKTSKKVTCTPPNVKCGGRCIPPNWDCRLKGQGTNSELKTHSQDISAGIASTQRGVSDLVKGVAKLNPAQVERGRRSVIRGAVKLAPGDNLEQKKQLRRKLEKNSSVVFAGLAISVAAAGGYKLTRGAMPAGMRNAIETPAKNAYNAVLDRAPFIGARRERNRAQGGMAASTIGGAMVRGARLQGAENAATGRTANGMGPLAFRTQSMNKNESGLDRTLDKINKEGSGRGFDSWRTEATQALFGAKTNNGKDSIYSERAANEFLTSQYGLSSNAVKRGTGGAADIRGNGTQNDRNKAIERELGAKINSMGSDFRRDMSTRGIVSQTTYIREVALKRVESKLGSLSAPQRKAALAEARTTIEAAMGGTGGKRAKDLRTAAVTGYNSYFAGVSRGVERFGGNPMNRESPVGDANQAFTRFEIGRKTGSQPQILSKSHGDMLLRHHYHTRVTNQKGDFVVSDSAARNVAQTISRSTTKPTAEQAIKVLQTNGFPQATLARASRSTGSTSKAKPKSGLGAAKRQSELAKSIMKREGFTGTLAEAYALARKEMKRGDSAPRGDDEHTAPMITKRNPPQPLVTNSTPTMVGPSEGKEHLPATENEMVTPLMPVDSIRQAPSPKEAEEIAEEEPTKPTGTVKISLNLEIPASAIKTDAMPPRVAAYLQTKRGFN